MDTKLQSQLEKMTAPPSAQHCFSVNANDWVDIPHSDFLDTDFHLPPLNRTENGYKSDVVVVLTTHRTVYGPTLESCLGYVQVPNDSEHTDYQYSLEWHSDDGEEVVGWMPVPVFHVDDAITLLQDTSKDKGFAFSYTE